MIEASLDEALILLSDWNDRGVWLGTGIFLREDCKEEHTFWSKVVKCSPQSVTLAGEYALVEIPFEDDVVIGYSEITDAPERLRERFSEYEFCLTIRSHKVIALLFGQRPKKE